MGHISGGAAGGIGFGVALFVLVTISLTLWWRRVHRDHFSKDPNTWGGSWGVQAMREAQARMDAENDAKYVTHLKQLEQLDIEMAQMESRKYMETGHAGGGGGAGGIAASDAITRPQKTA